MSLPRPTRPATLFLLLALTASPGHSQEVELLADLLPGPAPQGAGIDRFIRARSHLYFFRGGELWRTDATAAGTEMVREFDLNYGRPAAAELADGRLLFAAPDAAFGNELWVSDGTAAGTRLVADLCPGICDPELDWGHGRAAGGFLELGEEIVFVARTGSVGPYRLHAVGREAGPPRIVSELDPDRFTVSGDLVFLLERQSDGPWGLWVSDGQPGGEVLAAELPVTFARSFRPLTPEPGRPGVLLAATGTDDELEIFAGDAQGARRIVDAAEPSSLYGTATGPGFVYVSIADGGACRLLRTDGRLAGTFEIEAVAAAGGCARRLTAAGERLFFVLVTPQHTEQLWTSDGSEDGTVPVSDVFPSGDGGLTRLTSRGTELFFFGRGAGGPGLWKSDGTAAGTGKLRTFQQVDDDVSRRSEPLGVLGQRVVFAAEDLDTGLELWSSDGTAAGTAPLANLTADQASSSPRGFLARPGDVVFRTGSGFPALELYRADAAGDVELAYGTPDWVYFVLGKAGDRVLYETREDPYFGPTHVVAVDPETGEAEEVLTVPKVAEVAAVGRRLFLVTGRFFTSSINHREEIWVTDGTAAGTARAIGGLTDAEWPLDLLAWGDVLAFSGADERLGREPWISDGTPEGTGRLADLAPGPAGSDPVLMAAAGDRLYLRARLDGTDGGTTLVAVDRAGRVRGTVPVAEDDFPEDPAVALAGRVVWSAASYLDVPEAVWASDGSAAGTHLLGTFHETGPLVASGRRAYFTAATAEHGMELWVTDGTPTGTRLVSDLEPGRESSDPADLRAFGGSLLFSARTAATGREPWFSDGSAAGTRRLADVASGGRGSQPTGLVPVGERIVFAADRGDVGRELFALPRSAVIAPCVPGPSTLCSNGGRFAVAADWRDFAGRTGRGRAVPLTSDSGYFWFFGPGNVEVVVKVLDGCGFNDRFWVFAAGLTDVEVELTVTDLETGAVKSYSNPLGRPFAPILDTLALACP